MQYVSVERAIDTLAGLIPRIGRHSTATRGGESFVHQSDARVLSGRERDYATIETPGYIGVRYRSGLGGKLVNARINPLFCWLWELLTTR